MTHLSQNQLDEIYSEAYQRAVDSGTASLAHRAGLRAVIAADRAADAAANSVPVATAQLMGAVGFTMAVFKANDVPPGALVYGKAPVVVPDHLEENRAALVDYVNAILQTRARAAVAVPNGNDAAIAAIQFALSQGLECEQFLRLWNEGEFEVIRKEWPECPDSVFIGADPLASTKDESGPSALPVKPTESKLMAITEPVGWREVMAEMADDIECEAMNTYVNRDKYPTEMRRFKAATAVVNRARQLLAVSHAVSGPQATIGWVLEWTQDDLIYRRFYDIEDERQCRQDEEQDGGVCRALTSAKPTPLIIHAEFRWENNGIVGTTAARIQAIQHQDDGSITVVIDHWPAANSEVAS